MNTFQKIVEVPNQTFIDKVSQTATYICLFVWLTCDMILILRPDWERWRNGADVGSVKHMDVVHRDHLCHHDHQGPHGYQDHQTHGYCLSHGHGQQRHEEHGNHHIRKRTHGYH